MSACLLKKFANAINYNYEDLKALNPKYKGEIAPVNEGKLILRIPPGMQQAASDAVINSRADSTQFVADGDTRAYKIRSGDTLATIARRFRTTVAYIRDLNDLPRRKKLRVGMKIYVPDRNPIAEKSVNIAKNGKKANDMQISPGARALVNAYNDSNGAKFHIVQHGESLFSIAKKYSVKLTDLQKANNLSRGKTLKIGVKLIIPDNKDETKRAVNSGSRYQRDRMRVSLDDQRKPASRKRQ